MKLFKTGRAGKRFLIRLLGPGELLGYRAIVADEPYAATAEAVVTTTVCTIEGETLSRVFHAFSREKLIVLDRKSITLAKLQTLRRIATQG